MPSSRPYPRTKRLVDALAAALLLVVLAPLCVLIAAAIVAEGRGPVLFRQVRAGRYGRPFVLLKFRTLPDGPHDPERPHRHATRLGRVLRRWSLDELPQLVNVLRGEMSLVGPRPALPWQAAAYDAHARQRLLVPPGLTGWAQVGGRNALSWPERIERDVWYVHHRSFGRDAAILLATPRSILSARAALGDAHADEHAAAHALRSLSPAS